jgi:preprotein translocase subunit YajC
MTLLSILLQLGGGGAASGGAGWSMPLLFIGMIAIMYFLMIRPQQKKQKEVQKMRESLKVGDRVITSGGMYGKIKEVDDTAFIIEIADGVRVKVDKASIFAATNDSQAVK